MPSPGLFCPLCTSELPQTQTHTSIQSLSNQENQGSFSVLLFPFPQLSELVQGLLCPLCTFAVLLWQTHTSSPSVAVDITLTVPCDREWDRLAIFTGHITDNMAASQHDPILTFTHCKVFDFVEEESSAGGASKSSRDEFWSVSKYCITVSTRIESASTRMLNKDLPHVSIKISK